MSNSRVKRGTCRERSGAVGRPACESLIFNSKPGQAGLVPVFADLFTRMAIRQSLIKTSCSGKDDMADDPRVGHYALREA